MLTRLHRHREVLRQLLAVLLAALLLVGGWAATSLQALAEPAADDEEATALPPDEEAIAEETEDTEAPEDAEAIEEDADGQATAPADEQEDELALVTMDGNNNPEDINVSLELIDENQLGDCLFNDNTRTIKVNGLDTLPENTKYKVYINVGCWNGDPTSSWEMSFAPGVDGAYAFDGGAGPVLPEYGNAIVIDHDWVAAHPGEHEIELNGTWMAERGYDHVDVFLAAVYEPDSSDIDQNDFYRGDAKHLSVREIRSEWDREWDRDLLPGWNGTVNGSYHVRVEDPEHPDGWDGDYQVTDVQVVEGEDLLEDFHADSDDQGNRWWYYRAGQEYGTAVLEVTYAKPEELGGGTDSYTFELNIAGDVYDADLWVASGTSSTIAFPGESIQLVARGVNHHENAADTYDGFSYDWEIVEGTDAASIDCAANADGSSTATVQFNDYDGDEPYNRGIRVVMTASKGGVGIERDIYLFVSNDYPEIWLDELNSTVIQPDELPLRSQLKVTPVVRRFTQPGKDNYTTCDLRTLVWHFDENCISITDANGQAVPDGSPVDPGTFTLKRIGEWNTQISLDADWYDEDWDEPDGDHLRHEHAEWWLNDSRFGIWLDCPEGDDVFDDGTLTMWLRQNDPIADPYKIYLNIGPWDMGPGEPGFDWADGLAEGEGYTYDPESGKIVLDGAWLVEHGYDHLQVFASVAYEPEGHEDDWDLVGEGDYRWINVRQVIDEWDREWDRDLLPGWDGTVNGSYHVRVEDSDHPDGWEGDYRVTDVQVVEGEDLLEDFHAGSDDQGNRWWYYRAGKQSGTVVLKVTFAKPEELGGGTDSYTFELHIGSDVYEVRINANPGNDDILPGSVVELYAQGVHHKAQRQTDDQGNVWFDYQDTKEGLTYEWKLLEGAQAGTIKVDPKDPAHATFTAKTPSADKMGFDDFVHVRVYLHDGGDRVANRGWAFNVRNMFYELEPVDIALAKAGDTLQITPEMRFFVWGEHDEGKLLSDARFQFDEVDERRLSVTDAAGNSVANGDELASGGTYTITRLSPADTGFVLRCWYQDEQGEERYAERWYHFDEQDCQIRLSQDFALLHPSQTATVTLDTSNIDWLLENGKAALEIAAGEFGPEGLTNAFDDSSYTWDPATHTLTFSGPTLAELLGVEGDNSGFMGVDIRAVFDDLNRTYETHLDVNVSNRANLANATVKLDKTSFTYNGRAQTPKPTEVSIAPHPQEDWGWDWQLQEGVHYKVSYASNVNAGTDTGTITLTGINGMAGSIRKTFSIARATNAFRATGSTQYVLTRNARLRAQVVTGITFSGRRGTVTYANAKSVAKTKAWAVNTRTGRITVPKGTRRGVYYVKVNVTDNGGANYARVTRPVTVTVRVVDKYNQPMVATATAARVASYATVRTRAVVVARPLAVSKAQGRVTYRKASGSAALTVNATTGKVTVRKGTRKGTYSIRIKVTAAGNTSYLAGYKLVTCRVVVR